VSRRRPRASRVSHERWLVSYADLMTLLFAFFVVMFAVSRVDAGKVSEFRASVQSATSMGVMEHAGTSPIFDGTATVTDREQAAEDARVEQRKVVRSRLRHGLVAAIDAGRVAVVDGEDGVILRLREAAFFESASSTLRDGVISDLEAVGATLKGLPNAMRIEGHTDAQPIRSPHFRSNWELSAARAAEVLALFVARANIPENQLSVAGYGSQRPLESNATEDGRASNRRVDIVVIDPPAPKRGTVSEDRTSPTTAAQPSTRK
jgi:chemotaxis protein MotB